MATKKQWADGPFDLIPASRLPVIDGKVKKSHMMVGEMIIVHNMFIRGMNTIYLQCLNVQNEPADVVSDFVGYCLTWGLTLEEHHDGEEELIFPGIEEICGEAGLMAANVEQHAAFHVGLERYLAYLNAVEEGGEQYDGRKLKGIIDGFMPVLTAHLHDEIGTLLEVEKHEDKVDWKEWFDGMVQKIVKKGDGNPFAKTKAFPFMLQNHDVTFPGAQGPLPSWPPVPWPVLALIKWWYLPKFKGMWRFASCDSKGKPKDIAYIDAPAAAPAAAAAVASQA